ncbi:MAG: amidinotransferase [Prevotella sp.]|nr:amidinotransferase [Prevotella sp.]
MSLNQQTTSKVLMVRPVRFAFNEETAANNAFQQKSESQEAALSVERQAVGEFDAFVDLLRQNGVTVEVLQDTPEPFTPDSIFPNNCFSTHLVEGADGDEQRVLVVYPMFAHNRQQERAKLLAQSTTLAEMGSHSQVVDLTHWESEGKCLEGTGSLVLDREHRMAFACLSPRTDADVVADWASRLGYDYFLFHSEDENGTPVYHTNVVMHVGTRFAVVCLDSVPDADERLQLEKHLVACGKEVVPITFEQMHQFAGNMLELHNEQGEKLLVMSRTALRSLTPEQVSLLEQDVRIVAPDINAIETAGGGSARCMIAELY